MDIRLDAGKYTITGTITEGNGNTNFTMGLLMPEVIFMNFAEREVPLSPFPNSGINPTLFIVVIGAALLYAGGLIATRKYKITITKR